MELLIDTYYKNKKTGKFTMFHDKITEDDIKELIMERNKDNLPMWMDENWDIDSITIDEFAIIS